MSSPALSFCPFESIHLVPLTSSTKNTAVRPTTSPIIPWLDTSPAPISVAWPGFHRADRWIPVYTSHN